MKKFAEMEAGNLAGGYYIQQDITGSDRGQLICISTEKDCRFCDNCLKQSGTEADIKHGTFREAMGLNKDHYIQDYPVLRPGIIY